MILCFAKAIGEFGATITFVSNIPGETQTLPSAIYTFTQVPGGDAGALRLTLVSIAISMLALLASELLARRANRRLDARMTLAVDIKHRLGSFRLDARFADRRRAHALFGRSGSGKTSLVNVIAGLIRPDQGRVVVDGVTVVDTAARRLRAGPQAARRLRVPGRAAVPASDRAAEPALRPLVRARGRSAAASSTRSSTCSASAPARPPAGEAFRRREAARRHRPRACSPARACC